MYAKAQAQYSITEMHTGFLLCPGYLILHAHSYIGLAYYSLVNIHWTPALSTPNGYFVYPCLDRCDITYIMYIPIGSPRHYTLDLNAPSHTNYIHRTLNYTKPDGTIGTSSAEMPLMQRIDTWKLPSKIVNLELLGITSLPLSNIFQHFPTFPLPDGNAKHIPHHSTITP